MLPLKIAFDMDSPEDIPVFSSKGFTLLEVMVSISIIALVFVSLFRMQTKTIGLAESANFYSLAPILAETVLGKVCTGSSGEGKPWQSGTFSGNFSDTYSGFSFQYEITDANVDAMDNFPIKGNGLKKIHIKIFRTLGDQNMKYPDKKDQFYEVSTFRYLSQ